MKKNLEQAYDNGNIDLPISANDASNGLLLCGTCHTYFDKKPNPMIRIKPDGTIVLSGLAKTINYNKLDGTKVPWSCYIDSNKDFPNKSLLEFALKLKPADNKRLRELQEDSEESSDDIKSQKKKRATKAKSGENNRLRETQEGSKERSEDIKPPKKKRAKKKSFI